MISTACETDIQTATIPEHWPDPAPLASLRPIRIPWLIAPVVAPLALLLPRRLGPHLAASGMAAAVFAHFVWLIFAFGWPAMLRSAFTRQDSSLAILWPGGPLDALRGPLAGAALLAFEQISTTTDVLMLLALVGSIEAGVWLLAWLLTPAISVGESRGRAFLRAVKLVYWSTVMLAAMSLGMCVGAILARRGDIPRSDVVPFTAFWAALMLWGTVLLRLGKRYAGPALGPRFEPRVPRCEGCHYSLTALPLAGRCPECGRPVADSLPERRQPPAWARERRFRRAGAALFSTLVEGALGREFGSRLAVWRGEAEALSFALALCAVNGIIASAVAACAWMLPPGAALVGIARGRPLGGVLLLQFLMMGLMAWLMSLLALLVTWWLASGCAFRDGARVRTAVCYSYAMFTLAVALAGAGLVLSWIARESFDLSGSIHVYRDYFVRSDELLTCVLLIPALACAVLWPWRVARLVRQTRYAAA